MRDITGGKWMGVGLQLYGRRQGVGVSRAVGPDTMFLMLKCECIDGVTRIICVSQ